MYKIQGCINQPKIVGIGFGISNRVLKILNFANDQ